MHNDMMHAFIDFIVHFGVVAILLVVFAESGLLFGFIFPGDSLLFTAGYMVQQHILPIDIHFFALLLSLMAILGDSVGYAFGHKVGRKLFERKNSRFFKKKYLVHRSCAHLHQSWLALARCTTEPLSSLISLAALFGPHFSPTSDSLLARRSPTLVLILRSLH